MMHQEEKMGTATLRMVALLTFVLIAFQASAESKLHRLALKNGKVVEGDLKWEDDKTICLVTDGVEVNFKKQNVDLAKTKALNESTGEWEKNEKRNSDPELKEIKTLDQKVREAQVEVSKDIRKEKPPLADLTESLEKSRTGKSKSFKEGDEPSTPGYEFSEALSEYDRARVLHQIAECELMILQLESQEEVYAARNIPPDDYLYAKLEFYRKRLALLNETLQAGTKAKERNEKLDRVESLKFSLKEARYNLQLAIKKGSGTEINHWSTYVKYYEKELAKAESEANR